MAIRTNLFSGTSIANRPLLEEQIGRRIDDDEANKFASLAAVDDATIDELINLVSEGNRLAALTLLGFFVADDGASVEDLIEFVETRIVAHVREGC